MKNSFSFARFGLATATVSLLIATASPIAHAADPDPLALMQKSDKQHRIPSERNVASMVLQEKGGEQQTRTLETFALQDDTNGDRMKIRFLTPADIKDTTLLSTEDPKSKNTEQWLYLPAFRKTRRVGQAELGDRFVGSDIYFEDLQRRHVEEYAYKILRSEKLGEFDCWVIESTPSAPKVVKESPYGKSHLWMRKDNLLVIRVRHFDRKMKPLKEIELEDVRKVRGDAWRPDKTTIVDVKRKHRTVLVVTERQVDVAFPADTFSQHRLGSSD